MREERMAILNMLEKGIISAEEAQRLLTTLQEGTVSEGFGKYVNGALQKAGSALNTVARKAGETAEKIQPAVKNAAEKVADKAEELEPAAKNAAFQMREKASEFKDDVKNYCDKMKEKRESEDDDEFDFEDFDFDDVKEAAADVVDDVKEAVEDVVEEVKEAAEGILADDTTDDDLEEALDENVNAGLNALQQQMTEIDSAEDFLKSTFGDVDMSIFDEDEDGAPAEAAEEEKTEE